MIRSMLSAALSSTLSVRRKTANAFAMNPELVGMASVSIAGLLMAAAFGLVFESPKLAWLFVQNLVVTWLAWVFMRELVIWLRFRMDPFAEHSHDESLLTILSWSPVAISVVVMMAIAAGAF